MSMWNPTKEERMMLKRLIQSKDMKPGYTSQVHYFLPKEFIKTLVFHGGKLTLREKGKIYTLVTTRGEYVWLDCLLVIDI